MGDYVRNIACTALILGTLGSVCGTGRGVRKVVFGLLLAFVVIAPLRTLELGDFAELPAAFYRDGESVRDEAMEGTREDLRAVITGEVEAYILGEAASLGEDIQVEEIELDPDTMIPVSVSISGRITANGYNQLSEYIQRELGIGKEGQKWIGQP